MSKDALWEGLPPHMRHTVPVSSLACKTTLRASVTVGKALCTVGFCSHRCQGELFLLQMHVAALIYQKATNKW